MNQTLNIPKLSALRSGENDFITCTDLDNAKASFLRTLKENPKTFKGKQLIKIKIQIDRTETLDRLQHYYYSMLLKFEGQGVIYTG